jgi:hypothetical protein
VVSSNSHETQQKSHNIQPQTLIQAMIESEPCLFGNANPVDVKTVHIDSRELLMLSEVLEAARSHARYQVEFWQELAV